MHRTLSLWLLVPSLLGCATFSEHEPADGGGSLDGGPPDAPMTPDRPTGGSDFVPPACDIGDPCRRATDCLGGSECVAEQTVAVGPVSGHPEGATSVEITEWAGGYCTQRDPAGADNCDALDCGCGNCVVFEVEGGSFAGCAQACTPSIDDPDCRDGYRCDIAARACVPGCTSDAQCALYRDGDGELAYDADATWTCNRRTSRCEHVAPEGAQAGVPCTRDGQCETGGQCVLETEAGAWSGGYCVKLGCDLAGNECAGDGVCNEHLFDGAVCLAPCQVGVTEPPGDPFAPARDCRAGYACLWNGEVEGSGVCAPGVYGDVRTPNVGAACDATGDATECWSPHGLGACRDWDQEGAAGGTCTVLDCGAPGRDEAALCGDGAVCARVPSTEASVCLEACETASDCAPGLGCWDTTPAGIETGGRTVCFAACLVDADCRPDEACVGASAGMVGHCGPAP